MKVYINIKNDVKSVIKHKGRLIYINHSKIIHFNFENSESFQIRPSSKQKHQFSNTNILSFRSPNKASHRNNILIISTINIEVTKYKLIYMF